MKKNFLKIGEFARICRTTKETLLHYDRKGLLKPKYIADNGYRLYGVEQYFDFDFISLLKEAGCTLEEIKRHRSVIDASSYLKFFKKRIVFLHEEHARLAHRISMLTRLASMAEKAATSSFDTLFFENRQSEKVLFYPVDPEKMINRELSVECYSNCLMHSLSQKNTVDLPLGIIIPQKYAVEKYFKPCFIFRKVLEKEDGDIREIQDGRYACMFHHGDIESHICSFASMMDKIKEMNLQILSDMYVYDQMSYVLPTTDITYTAEYIVRIG